MTMNSLLSRLRITARLYGGFGLLVAIGFAVAVISVWQFGAVGGAFDKYGAITTNTVRNLQVQSLVNDMRRLQLRYKTSAEEETLKAFVEDRTLAEELLTVAAKETLSEDRRKLYNEIHGNITTLQTLMNSLVDTVKKQQSERTVLFSGGDELTASTNALVEAARSGGDAAVAAHA